MRLFLFWSHLNTDDSGDEMMLLQPTAPDDSAEKEAKFAPTGNDKDLAANLERDIVSRNPKVYW